MLPGRELDGLIATNVFGYEVVLHNQIGRPDIHYKFRNALILVPQYSKQIASAIQITEKIPMVIYSPRVIVAPGQNNGEFWMVVAWATPQDDKEWEKRIAVFGQSASHAICLAALEITRARP